MLEENFKNYDFNYVKKSKKLIKMLPKLNLNNYKDFKEIIYNMYIDDIDFRKYIKIIVNEVIPLFKNDNNKFKVIQLASKCDLDILQGNKPPIHFEKFIIDIYNLILNIKKS